jgi:ABC-type transporter Mla MlaB component
MDGSVAGKRFASPSLETPVTPFSWVNRSMERVVVASPSGSFCNLSNYRAVPDLPRRADFEEWDDLMRFVSDDDVDPQLEIWVDCSQSPVAVRLTGVLDRTTRAAFLSLMDELILEGVQTFVMNTGAVEVADALGAEALVHCQRRAREAGRTLMWDGVDFGPPSSVLSKYPSMPYRHSSTPVR